jgi:hypothetical protein
MKNSISNRVAASIVRDWNLRLREATRTGSVDRLGVMVKAMISPDAAV